MVREIICAPGATPFFDGSSGKLAAVMAATWVPWLAEILRNDHGKWFSRVKLDRLRVALTGANYDFQYIPVIVDIERIDEWHVSWECSIATRIDAELGQKSTRFQIAFFRCVHDGAIKRIRMLILIGYNATTVVNSLPMRTVVEQDEIVNGTGIVVFFIQIIKYIDLIFKLFFEQLIISR